MAQSEQQRQRKLAKKQSKNRDKHKQIARTQQNLASMAGKMQASAKGEIVYCGICGTITESGLGHVVIARQGPSRQVGLAMFLVDTRCLGVKDILAVLRGPSEAKEMIQRLEIERESQPVAPGLARGLVEAAVEYARSLGFEPHSDYRKASMIWGDIKPESVEGDFEFGRDGMPFYINGPFEDAARQQHILRTLERTVGEGNFHYFLEIAPSATVLDRFSSGDYEGIDEDDDFELPNTVGRSLDAEGVRRLDEPHS